MKKNANAMDGTLPLHGYTSSTLTPKPSCTTPVLQYFYVFNFEAVA